MVGLNSYQLKASDQILWVYGTSPIKLTATSENINSGATTTLSAFIFDSNSFVWQPANDAEFRIDGNLIGSGNNGTLEFSTTTNGTYNFVVQKSGYLNSPAVSITVSSGDSPAPVTIPTSSPVAPTFAGGGCGACLNNPSVTPVTNFDIAKAADFLKLQQLADGSFGSSLLTDWAAYGPRRGKSGWKIFGTLETLSCEHND